MIASNMIDLTARQVQILRAIIEEFIDTAEPVGSETVDKKYRIGVSPATIRNEMVQLEKQGYLQKGHSSAGRIPTPIAMKLYVNELMKEQELSVADEVSAKERIWKSRKDMEDLLREATEALSERARAVAIATRKLNDHRRLYHHGTAHLLNMPEFYDINVTRHVLNLIEEESLLEEIFDHAHSESLVQMVFGRELGNKHLEPVAILYTDVIAGGQPCRIALLGSTRFEYDYVVPVLKYFRKLIEELAEEDNDQ